MGVRERGCSLKTAASIFETDLECESYNPNVYGAWWIGKISDRNLSKVQDVEIWVWYTIVYRWLCIAYDL